MRVSQEIPRVYAKLYNADGIWIKEMPKRCPYCTDGHLHVVSCDYNLPDTLVYELSAGCDPSQRYRVVVVAVELEAEQVL